MIEWSTHNDLIESSIGITTLAQRLLDNRNRVADRVAVLTWLSTPRADLRSFETSSQVGLGFELLFAWNLILLVRLSQLTRLWATVRLYPDLDDLHVVLRLIDRDSSACSSRVTLLAVESALA